MYPAYLLVFRQYIVINVLTCRVDGLRSLSPKLYFFSVPVGLPLVSKSSAKANDEMLRDVGKRLHRIVSWAVVVPA